MSTWSPRASSIRPRWCARRCRTPPPLPVCWSQPKPWSPSCRRSRPAAAACLLAAAWGTDKPLFRNMNAKRPPPGGLVFGGCHSGLLLKMRRSRFTPRGICMRALLFVAAGLFIATATSHLAVAQIKLSTKPDPNAIENRYFTAIDGLMDGNADVILKETRQGKTVNAATLDLCYPAEKNSDRKDRFVVNLAVNGQTMTGSATSLVDKKPVTVKLTRKQSADTFDFRGQITIGQTVTE